MRFRDFVLITVAVFLGIFSANVAERYASSHVLVRLNYVLQNDLDGYNGFQVTGIETPFHNPSGFRLYMIHDRATWKDKEGWVEGSWQLDGSDITSGVVVGHLVKMEKKDSKNTEVHLPVEGDQSVLYGVVCARPGMTAAEVKKAADNFMYSSIWWQPKYFGSSFNVIACE